MLRGMNVLSPSPLLCFSIEHVCFVSSILRQKQHALDKHTNGVINNVNRIMHAGVHEKSMHSDNNWGGTHCSHSVVVALSRVTSSMRYYEVMVQEL